MSGAAPGLHGLPAARIFEPSRTEIDMFNWLRRRRLSPEARRKLLLLSARAEQAIVDTHAQNLLDMLHALGDEVDLDRAIELYVEMVSLDETMAASVTTRVLSRLEAMAEKGGREARRYRHVFR